MGMLYFVKQNGSYRLANDTLFEWLVYTKHTTHQCYVPGYPNRDRSNELYELLQLGK